MAISKKVRFEVFKRDSFTCQYCGRAAPDAVLELDHIDPCSNGGSDEILNLLTSCFDCNRGKSDRCLEDDTVLTKQKAQLDRLQERREQIAEMMEWQKSLLTIEQDTLAQLVQFWASLTPGWTVNESGTADMRKWLRQYTVAEIMSSMRTAATQYLEVTAKGKVTKESWGKAFSFIPRICRVNKQSIDKPYLRDIYYIRGILRKRLDYVNERDAITLLQECAEAGISLEHLKSDAKEARSWNQFSNWLCGYLKEVRGEAVQ